jgi:hypothetical protein
LEQIATGNWITLQRCPACSQLWCEVPYEPHASYPYLVQWPTTESKWQAAHAKDDGLSLGRWHSQSIVELWQSLPAEERKYVESHRVRSYDRFPPAPSVESSDVMLERMIR